MVLSAARVDGLVKRLADVSLHFFDDLGPNAVDLQLLEDLAVIGIYFPADVSPSNDRAADLIRA